MKYKTTRMLIPTYAAMLPEAGTGEVAFEEMDVDAEALMVAMILAIEGRSMRKRCGAKIKLSGVSIKD